MVCEPDRWYIPPPMHDIPLKLYHGELNLAPTVLGFLFSLLLATLIVTPLFWRWRYALTWRKASILVLLMVLFLLVCPLSQPIIMEPMDGYLNYRFRDRAIAAGLVKGMTPEQVKTILGAPDWTESHSAPSIQDAQGHVEWRGEPYDRWCYKPLPIYWVGSKFEVFFEHGVVTGFEANDD